MIADMEHHPILADPFDVVVEMELCQVEWVVESLEVASVFVVAYLVHHIPYHRVVVVADSRLEEVDIAVVHMVVADFCLMVVVLFQAY